MSISGTLPMRINFIVVVYATPPALTATIKSLSSINYSTFGIEASFSIWDNSPQGFGNASVLDLAGSVRYYHNGRNERLSVAYNTITSGAEAFEYFIILDDDSEINDRYIYSLKAFFQSDVPVAVPQIFLKNDLISPGTVEGIRGKKIYSRHLKSGERQSTKLVAMMSGTVIHKTVFSAGIKFDERLNFYGVDTRFFIDYARRYPKVFILDATLTHSSALRTPGEPYESRVGRLKNLILSKLYVFDRIDNHRLKIVVYLFLFCIKTIIRERNVRYISLLGLAPRIVKPQD